MLGSALAGCVLMLTHAYVLHCFTGVLSFLSAFVQGDRSSVLLSASVPLRCTKHFGAGVGFGIGNHPTRISILSLSPLLLVPK